MNIGSDSSEMGTTLEEGQGLKPASGLARGIRFEESGEDDAASITVPHKTVR
jgi:hypothetical protein